MLSNGSVRQVHRVSRKAALAVFLFAWTLITHGKYSASGDEPHYLMVTHSIVVDHDMDVANNYADNDGRFFGHDRLEMGLHAVPARNGHVRPIHDVGLAVALDWGLIVPVIKRADDLSISGLARAANDLADRARAKQLKPDEVAGGTFTITNPGVFGGLFGTPIINQPQVAILGVGVIEKRPKVITSAEGDDLIAIRQMAYFALTFDHRIVDGSDAEKFLGYVKEILEAGKFAV